MIEFFLKNKEWIFSGIGVFLLGIIISILSSFRRSKEKRQERIQCFNGDFRSLYKNDGFKLKLLIPAGINNLKNDKEIKRAFESLMLIIPNHPLRNWKDRVEKVGYKNFFTHVAVSGKELNKDSIETFLNELENKKKKS